MGDWRADVSLAGRVNPFEFCRWWRFADVLRVSRMLRRQNVVYVYSLKRCENGSRWLPRGRNEQIYLHNQLRFCFVVPVFDYVFSLVAARTISFGLQKWQLDQRQRCDTVRRSSHSEAEGSFVSVVSTIHVCLGAPQCCWKASKPTLLVRLLSGPRVIIYSNIVWLIFSFF